MKTLHRTTVVLCGALVACGGGTNTNTDARPDTATQAETGQTEASVDAEGIDVPSMDVVVDTAIDSNTADVQPDTAPNDTAPPDVVSDVPSVNDASDSAVEDSAMNMCMPGTVTCGVMGACIDLMTDSAHCGMCGRACSAGQSCVAGSCACSMGRQTCGGSCVDVQSDNMHCGACGTVCGAGQTCMAGRCTCPMGQTACGMGATSTCVSTAADPMNCGACGMRCAMGQTCSMGTCACATGQTVCGSGAMAACTNTQSDNANCGMCGAACAMGQSCVMGVCQCPSGQTLCGGVCVDTQSDRANCGMCGTACPSGQVCNAGTCRADCTAPQVPCGSGTMMSCANTQTDENNCGMCGNRCAMGQSCSMGMCVCPMGQTACTSGGVTRCANTRSDNANCGACGRSCSGGPNVVSGVCSDGSCTLICNPGFANCDGDASNGCEVNLASNASNCGSCGNACAATGMCFAGMCSATSCRTLHAASPGLPSGVYPIDPDGVGPLPPVSTYCDMTTAGGGWTLVMRAVANTTMNQMLRTTLDTFRNNTIGNATPGNFFRMAATHWPALQSTEEHMIAHLPQRTDGSACNGALYYVAPRGRWVVPATGNITVTGVQEPPGGVTIFNGRATAGISATDIDNDSWGSSCVNTSRAAPWFYGACCSTCFTYELTYWPAGTARPMANYLGVRDVNNRNVTDVCAGSPPVQTSSGFFGEASMEYYLR